MTVGSVESHCQEETKQAIDALLDLITPYYKSFPLPGEPPEFKKSLSGEEILNVLTGVHHVITEIMVEQ